PLAELVAGLPLPLVRAVERSLAKDPAVRYQTLEDLRVELLGMPDVTPADTAAEGLRDAVERKFSEVVRLHRTLVAAIGASALGEETLPIADPVAEGRAAGAGLETVLHDLESQTERLRALARTVERVEPRVARGIAAFEHGAFAEAVAELDAVLREIPQHQRARDYRERARLEEIRERTVRSVGAGSVVSAPRATPGPAEPLAAREAEAGTAVATPPPRQATPAPLTAAGTQLTQAVSGTRARLLLVGVALGAVVSGGVFLFRPSSPPREAVPAPAVAPAPAPTPAPAPSPAKPPSATPVPSAPPASAVPTPNPAPVPAKAPGSGAGGGGSPAPRLVAPAKAAPAPARPGEGGATAAKPTSEDAKVLEDALTLAQLFRGRGDNERALREYRRVLAIDPNHAEARQGVAEAEALLKSRQ
ncbi:MAG: hypothetical protein HY359_07270, partial [Candidatus Rokubacteria bacterium]|nr:hypothetical protein [Candidatus Rokubacteria bacterium]